MVKVLIASGLLIVSGPLFSQIDTIKTVEITTEESAQKYDLNGARLTTTFTENEFKKAACCTLSESFDLSNTVEVSNKDGISGIRQVEMLGLSGKYVLMTRNNMPILNGIAQLNGLSNIPGAFVSNVNIAKGNGSATLGYEGLTGGIDYDLKSSEKEPRLFFNAYQNNQGRTEANLMLRKDINRNLRNFTYLHGGTQWMTTDMNRDGYTDMPVTDRIYLGNQTHFQTKNTEGMVGVTYWEDGKMGGATNEIGGNELTTNPSDFMFRSKESRLDVFAKLGLIPTEGETTFGNIFNFSRHRMDYNLNSLIGRTYNADELRFNYSGLMQTELTETWGLKTGVSFLATQLDETFNSSLNITPLKPPSYQGDINELQFGAFGEAVYATDDVKMVLGARIDHHNYHGWFVTPRTHIKWDINRKNSLFVQGGYGRRQAYVISENLPYLINNRVVNADFLNRTEVGNLPYGFNQERGWNYGISYLKRIMFLGYPSSISIDVFRNQFDSRIVMDQEKFYAVDVVQLTGKDAGYSESIHTEWSFMPAMRFEVRLAYRYVNNVQKLGGVMQLTPLLSQHRGLATLTYKTRNNWYFDVMGNLNGSKRLFEKPQFTSESLETPTYALFNMQIRKSWNSGWEVYLGAENIGNFRQLDPIITYPATGAIDASYSWGPSNGRMIYAGVRFELR
jgi:outer membrane receptor for ferrienterochelin and colicin